MLCVAVVHHRSFIVPTKMFQRLGRNWTHCLFCPTTVIVELVSDWRHHIWQTLRWLAGLVTFSTARWFDTLLPIHQQAFAYVPLLPTSRHLTWTPTILQVLDVFIICCSPIDLNISLTLRISWGGLRAGPNATKAQERLSLLWPHLKRRLHRFVN